MSRRSTPTSYDPLVRSFIPPHMTNTAAPSRASGTYTWGCTFYTAFAATMYGARVAYVQTASPENVKALLYRVSDSALVASGTRTLSVTGQYDIAFDTPFVGLPATRYRIAWYIAGAYITHAITNSPLQGAASNFDAGAGVYYESTNLFIGSAEAMPTTSGAARTPIAVLVR